MVVVAKDAGKQLYASLWSALTGDSELITLLDGNEPENPKIYQSFIDFSSAFALKNSLWVTFGIINDRPMEIEQMQDVHELLLDVHVWQRGPGSDRAEDVERRTREILDNADLSTDTLFAWYCHFTGYNKVYEAVPQLWHVSSTYRIMCMSIEAT